MRHHVNTYFWRTYTGAELDFVEQGDGKLLGYEIKWKNKKAKAPKTWMDSYNESYFKYINLENYQDFCCI
ncbi:DUF4143 domain-containing protein [Maribellus comscasis]|uniref:DUF4143 domain-containing protein n=1 Tax=Maribellus comscasis TaxID=2681766 RepID=UPI003CCE1F5A